MTIKAAKEAHLSLSKFEGLEDSKASLHRVRAVAALPYDLSGGYARKICT